MRIEKLSIGLLFGITLLFAACGQAPESDQAEVSDAKEVKEASMEAKTYPVDVQSSSVTWVGSKQIGDRHTGTIKLSEGVLSVKDGEIESGSFIIDMNSIHVLDDMEEKYEVKLTNHLKNEDFFLVDSFPTAKFVITSVEPYTARETEEASTDIENEFKLPDNTHMITGNLTIRGVEKSIKFPAKINITDDGVKAEGKFNFDRTQFNVHYGSEESLKDKMILHEIFLHLQLETKPQDQTS